MLQYVLETASQLDQSPEAILEVGCGSGGLLLELAQRFPGARLCAIDPSKRAVRRAIRHLGGRAEIRRASAEELPYDDNSFDLVITKLSFHHWSNQQAGLDEIYRVLKPGSHLILVDPHAEGAIKRPIWRKGAELLDGGKFIGLDALRQELVAAGFIAPASELLPKTWGTIYLTSAQK